MELNELKVPSVNDYARQYEHSDREVYLHHQFVLIEARNFYKKFVRLVYKKRIGNLFSNDEVATTISQHLGEEKYDVLFKKSLNLMAMNFMDKKNNLKEITCTCGCLRQASDLKEFSLRITKKMFSAALPSKAEAISIFYKAFVDGEF